MQYRRSLHIPPLRPARLAAATLRRARVTAHSRPAAGPSEMELHLSLPHDKQSNKVANPHP